MKKLVIEFETRQERLQEVLDYYKRIKKEYPYAEVHIRVKA